MFFAESPESNAWAVILLVSLSDALSRLKNDERNGRAVLWLDQKESYVSAMLEVLEVEDEDEGCNLKDVFDTG